MLHLYMRKEAMGPVETAQKFNFHIRHLRYTGLISYKFDELSDFLILQKNALIQLCSCVIYSKLAVVVVVLATQTVNLNLT